MTETDRRALSAGLEAARPDRPARFEGLEAYRGLAAILILVFHAYQFSREGLGLDRYVYEGRAPHVFFANLETAVSWFFVLSGFLIFLPFASSAIRQGSPRSARTFLIKRALRILPLYYFAILVVWSLRYTGGRDQWIDLLQHLTFTHVFFREHIFYTIGPAWSLGVEVIFYVLVAGLGPLIYHVCGRLGTPRERVAFVVASVSTLALLSIGYKWWAFYFAQIPETNYPVYFGPLAKLDTFAFGMLLAVVVAVGGTAWLPRLRLGGVALLLLGGVALMAAAFALRDDNGVVTLYFHTISSVAFTMVLAATVLAVGEGRATLFAFLRWPSLSYVGLVSYSVYMWHEPIMVELSKYDFLVTRDPEAFPQNALVLAVVSVFVATVSYRAIERPAMQLQYLFDRGGRDGHAKRGVPEGTE